MSVKLPSVSDLLQQKQSAATSGDKSLQEAFDLCLANFVLTKMEQDDLVFCPVSATVRLRTEVVSGAFIYWNTHGGTKTVACIDNGRRYTWLFFEDQAVLKRQIANSKRKYDQWLATGGLHNRDQWWGPCSAHAMPSEYTAVRLVDGQLEAYLHLYSRWVKLRQLCDPCCWQPNDLRRTNVLEQWSNIHSHFELPRANLKREKKVLDHFGLPEPFDYLRFGGADGHRSRCRDSSFYAGCHWL